MKKTFITFSLFFFTGCVASVVTTNLELPYVSERQQIKIVDERPKNQSRQKMMSANAFSCKSGSYQIGEEGESPNRIKLLKNYLSNNLSTNIDNHTIRIKNFVIHVNARLSLRRDSSKALGGGIFSLIENIGRDETIGCSKDDLWGGYSFDEVSAELTQPLIAVIDVEVNNKIYHSRALIELKHWFTSGTSGWDSQMQEVIIHAASQLADSINADNFTNLQQDSLSEESSK